MCARDVRSCRFCNTELRHTFVDLGMSPLCETFLDSEQLDLPERFFPLRPRVCHECFLVQLDEYVALEEIFDDRYPYYASYSDTWVEARAALRGGHDRPSFARQLESRRRGGEQRRVLVARLRGPEVSQYWAWTRPPTSRPWQPSAGSRP
jgi:hypothetical protein